ncbi:MAG: carbon-nitrogen hydrolase family protein [Candidatus Brockarchaeota archaeon]|nr:carbon-nitrogen hydrolase family protein [Candidatus Brockarchaeota archaeon]
MKVAIAQVRCNWSNPVSKNLRKAIGFVEKAGRSGTDVVCFPEYFLGKGAILGDPKRGEETEAALRTLGEKAKESEVAIVCGAMREARKGQRKLVVTCPVIGAKGDIVKKIDRAVPYPGERELVQPGADADVAEIGGSKVGVLAGFDVFFSPAVQKLKEKDADLVIYQLSASTRFLLEAEQAAAVARCQEMMVPFVAVGQLGEYFKSQSLGGSLVCVPSQIKLSNARSHGGVKVVRKLGAEERLDTVHLDIQEFKQQRKKYNLFEV